MALMEFFDVPLFDDTIMDQCLRAFYRYFSQTLQLSVPEFIIILRALGAWLYLISIKADRKFVRSNISISRSKGIFAFEDPGFLKRSTTTLTWIAQINAALFDL